MGVQPPLDVCVPVDDRDCRKDAPPLVLLAQTEPRRNKPLGISVESPHAAAPPRSCQAPPPRRKHRTPCSKPLAHDEGTWFVPQRGNDPGVARSHERGQVLSLDASLVVDVLGCLDVASKRTVAREPELEALSREERRGVQQQPYSLYGGQRAQEAERYRRGPGRLRDWSAEW